MVWVDLKRYRFWKMEKRSCLKFFKPAAGRGKGKRGGKKEKTRVKERVFYTPLPIGSLSHST